MSDDKLAAVNRSGQASTFKIQRLEPTHSEMLTATRRREVFTGRTDSSGTATVWVVLSTGNKYPYAIAFSAFEKRGGGSQPSGVGDAALVATLKELNPVERAGTFETDIIGLVTAKDKKNSATGSIMGNLYDHPPCTRALDFVAYIEYELSDY